MARSRMDAEFTEFVQARWQSLYRTAYLLVGDDGSAEDLVQKTLAKAYVAWGRIRITQAADAYVRRVMVMTAMSWRRRTSWRAERPADDVPGPAVNAAANAAADGAAVAAADAVTRREVIWSEIARLPPRQRAIVVLRCYEDLSEKQIAHVMECSTGTVKSEADSAMRTLRAALGDEIVPELMGEER
jgi:RNA polymerase sigma-70 factor (sigma-E family)